MYKLRKTVKKQGPVVYLLLLAFIAAALIGIQEHRTVARQQDRIRHLASGNTPIADIPNFAHIFVILEENDSDGNLLGNPKTSFISNLISHYSLATNYEAITHPSLPNYLAITGGSTYGVTSNCLPVGDNSCAVNAPSIVDSIEHSGRTWKAYYESMPQPCAVTSTASYDVATNPFIHHKNILDNEQRCAGHVVPFTQFNADLAAGSLPDFAFIVPNMCNNTHNCPLATGDKWLASTATQLLDSNAFTDQNSLLAITWDEPGEKDANYDVPLILAGPQVKRSYQSARRYNHYSLLHTIEKAWSLDPLTKNDANAPILQEFFAT